MFEAEKEPRFNLQEKLSAKFADQNSHPVYRKYPADKVLTDILTVAKQEQGNAAKESASNLADAFIATNFGQLSPGTQAEIAAEHYHRTAHEASQTSKPQGIELDSQEAELFLEVQGKVNKDFPIKERQPIYIPFHNLEQNLEQVAAETPFDELKREISDNRKKPETADVIGFMGVDDSIEEDPEQTEAEAAFAKLMQMVEDSQNGATLDEAQESLRKVANMSEFDVSNYDKEVIADHYEGNPGQHIRSLLPPKK